MFDYIELIHLILSYPYFGKCDHGLSKNSKLYLEDRVNVNILNYIESVIDLLST